MKKELDLSMPNGNTDYLAKYYDLLYEEEKEKNYQKESEQLMQIIEKHRGQKAETLLDVGCGTGSHLKYLYKEFKCTGIDVSGEMIENAREKVSDTSFEIIDMLNFQFNWSFDVIICLFGTIGFSKTYEDLVKTLENFKSHLSDDGIVILEPWIYFSDFEDRDKPHMTTAEDDDVSLVRMGQCEIEDSKRILNFHYLVGEKGEIHYSKEVHELLALNRSGYVEAFEEAGFQIIDQIERGEDWSGARELFVLREDENR